MNKYTYKYSGSEQQGGKSEIFSGDLVVVEKTIILDDAARDSSGLSSIELDDDDIVEVELDHISIVLTVAELNERNPEGQNASRSGSAKTRKLPTNIGSSPESRGIVGLAIRVLRVLGISIPEKLIDIAASKIESGLEPSGPGLYRVNNDGQLSPDTLPTGDQPVLLLLHGTASSTRNAFSSLLPFKGNGTNRPVGDNHLWNEIVRVFEDRIYALEQKTLTESPLNNLLQFLDSWPDSGGPPLVLLSHSRGGIVGDYLSALIDWTPDTEEFLGLFRDNEMEKHLADQLYRKVMSIPSQARPAVLRHVRVGSPAAGTSLASKNTHVWLSVLSQLLGKIPGAGTAIEAIADLAVAVIKEGLKPDILPGIAAQRHDSPSLRFSNALHCSNTDLIAISGESKGLIKESLEILFEGAHDLVVDTRSMLKGPRYRSRFELAICDHEIIHTRYFTHSETSSHLLRALMGELDNTDFVARTSLGRGRIKPANVQNKTSIPALILLPGIMGSELSEVKGNERQDIWLDYPRLAFGQGSKLDINVRNIQATGVLEQGYEAFSRHAKNSEQCHLIPFGYDWRQSVFQAAKELQKLIEKRLAAAPEQPIALVCHSMGGLVARAWRQENQSTWTRITQQNGRMIQIGTPNYGSWVIPKILCGNERILSLIALLDFPNSKTDWLKRISKFEGLIELSVFDNPIVDLSKTNDWKALGAKVLPTSTLLKNASKTMARLGTDKFEQDEHIIYIAGCAEWTPALSTNGKELVKKRFAGDGRVLWPEPDNQRPVNYYINAVHGDLLNHAPDFDNIITLALTGSAQGLSTRIPSDFIGRGSADQHEEQPLDSTSRESLILPSREDLEAAAIGGTLTKTETSGIESTRLNVTITHGDLMYTKKPLMVGHYLGDSILRAERALDSSLGDVLTRRWKLGQQYYAGDVGSSEIVLRKGNRLTSGPAGAIVVGLGPLGELQKGLLISTVRDGVIRYIQHCEEAGMDCRNLELGTLLIGSGQEQLVLFDVLDAIINGVIYANEIFAASHATDRVVKITSIEFIEWYLDLAISARHELERLKETLPINLAAGINKQAGGHTRPFTNEATEWWETLKVEWDSGDANMIEQGNNTNNDPTGQKLCTLKFSVLGGRAMGLTADIKFNKREIDTLQKTMLSHVRKPDPGKTQALFEQLIPASLKPLAAQRRNIIVNLDPKSASLPWEILVDRQSGQGAPLAVVAGLLRRIIPDIHQSSNAAVTYAERNEAIVIGNPPGGLQFPFLDGALTEAKRVVGKFTNFGWTVNDQHIYESEFSNLSTACDIRKDIFVNDYRVIHFAAHGIFNAEKPSMSGVIIGYDETTDTVELFSPHHVKAIRRKPSLVFINCCHTGQIDNWNNHHELSASLATEFIRAGVHCVIGAAWAVDDKAALSFAERIYDELLSGRTYGIAIKVAREQVYNDYQNTNTWAAFQCYGNPGFVLSKRAHKSGRLKARQYFDSTELICELANFYSDLEAAKDPDISHQSYAKKLYALIEIAETNSDAGSGTFWIDDGRVLTYIAILSSGLKLDALATQYIKRASEADQSDVPQKYQLILINCQLRQAEYHVYELQNSGDYSDPDRRTLEACDKTVEGCIRLLKDHCSINRNATVLQHLASAYKHSAMLTKMLPQKKGQKKAALIKSKLETMADYYEKSIRYSTENSIFYPHLNAWLGYLLLKSLSGGRLKKEQKEKIALLAETAEATLPGKSTEDFWHIIARHDYDCTRMIHDGKFTEINAQILAGNIVETVSKYGSKWQADSVIKQYRYIHLFARGKTERESAKLIYEYLEVYL